jgi:hypothetical protein
VSWAGDPWPDLHDGGVPGTAEVDLDTGTDITLLAAPPSAERRG